MNLFTTGVLAKIVQQLPNPEPFILNSFFRQIQTDSTEEIHFDTDLGSRRLAPFVSPVVAGQVVQSRGYQTKTFRPAYVKDKRIFSTDRPFKRAMGEGIGGNMAPAERLQLALVSELNDQIAMLTRRQEVMAIEALRTGKVTVSGDLYPTTEVNFGRDPDLTKRLTGAASWGESGIDPLDDVQAWSLLVAEKSGAAADVLVMDLAAWTLFSASAKVQKLLDRYRGADRLNSTVSGEGGRYMGRVGDFDVWVYVGWYEDPESGALVPYLPANTVILSGKDLEGTRAYGAIRDEAAGLQPMPYFAKSWVEEDPAVRYMLLQSAPLTVPYRINASFCATVR